MSEPIPESIPTSADPRSKRPTKKRALTPSSAQSAQVEALFAKPDREIRIPDSSTGKKSSLPPPPEIVANVQGSSAGAGSGEFHVYKASRRREYERLRLMEDEVRQTQEDEDYQKAREERERQDQEKTSKNKKRRDKQKQRKEKAKMDGKDGEASKDNGMAGADGFEDRDSDAKRLKPNPMVRGETTGASSKNVAGTSVANGDAPPEIVEEAGIVIHDDD